MSNDSTSKSADSDGKSQIAIQVTSQKGNNERGTPKDLIRPMLSNLGKKFSLDPCSGAEPIPIATTRFTKEDDGLLKSWQGHDTAYVNPPYDDLDQWLQKGYREFTRENGPSFILYLVPGNSSTQWFQNYATKCDYLVLIEGRLNFDGTDNSAPFASMLCAFGEPPGNLMEWFDSIGTVYEEAEIDTASEQATFDDLLESDGAVPAPGPVGTTSRPTATPSTRDLSRQAPATPGPLALEDVTDNDRLRITIDGAGTSTQVPMQFTAQPVGITELDIDESPRNEPVTQLDCLAARDDGHTDLEQDVYLRLYQGHWNRGQLSAALSIDGAPFEPVPVASVHRTASPGPRPLTHRLVE